MSQLRAALLLALMLSACVEPPDPHLSRIDQPSVIVLRDGREIECPRVVEAGRGWECWPSLGTEDYAPLSWYAPDQVAEVRRASQDTKTGGTE